MGHLRRRRARGLMAGSRPPRRRHEEEGPCPSYPRRGCGWWWWWWWDERGRASFVGDPEESAGVDGERIWIGTRGGIETLERTTSGGGRRLGGEGVAAVPSPDAAIGQVFQRAIGGQYVSRLDALQAQHV